MRTGRDQKSRSKSGYHYNLHTRAVLLCAGFVTLLTALSIRLIHVQHTRHEAVMKKILTESLFKDEVRAPRGDVMDRNRRVLATTEPVINILFDWHQIPKKTSSIQELAKQWLGFSQEDLDTLTPDENEQLYFEMLASRLAPTLLREPQEILETLQNPKKEFYLQKDLPANETLRAVKLLKSDGFKGLRCEKVMKRVYTCGKLACHVLGFTFHDLQGAAGIEQYMNAFLSGTDGVRYFNRQKEFVGEDPFVPGKHVVLTLDSTFQRITEDILDRHYAALNPVSITAIFAEPYSGEILAMASRPGFLPSDGGNAAPDTRRNTAIGAVYEPGSPFKLITLGTALDRDFVGLDTVVNCHHGHLQEPGFTVIDASSGRASASVREVLTYSLNTGTFQIVQQVPPPVLFESIQAFGLGERTGIRLPAEEHGFIRHPDDSWGFNRRDLSRVAIGYMQNATPLQTLGIMSVICNQGELVKPRVVKEILSPDMREVTAFHEREVVRRVLKRNTARSLRNTLINVVEKGTGKRAQIEGFIVGGKTGTAEKLIDGEYVDNRNITSFLGFVATETDTPLIGIVVVDDPKSESKRYGGTIAAPIFQEIGEAGMRHFGFRKMEVANQEEPHS